MSHNLTRSEPALILVINSMKQKESSKRPSWDDYFLNLADFVSRRSTCLRKKVGAVIVRDKRVIATGYNGTCIPGGEHCIDLGYCERDAQGVKSGTRYEVGNCTHAEASAIFQCAKFGIASEGTTLYVNGLICILCAKMAVSAGITRIVCIKENRPQNGISFLKKAEVEVKLSGFFSKVKFKPDI